MARRRALWSLLAAAALAAGCGAGGGGAPEASAEDPAAGARPAALAVVTADLDLDGLGDLAAIPLGEDPEAPRCWRASAGGLRAVAGWEAHPVVEAIRRDLARRGAHDVLDLLADEGVGRLPAESGLGEVPYAVLHVEDGDARAAGEAPVLDAVHPDAAPAGALVGLRGTGLAAPDLETGVSFEDVAARVLLALPRFVLAIVPERAPLGVVDVTVSVGRRTSRAARCEVLAAPVPEVEAIRPDPVVPGILAVITGRHLGTPADDVRVTFAGAPAEHVLALGTKLVVQVPAAAVSGRLGVLVDGVPGRGLPVEVARALDAPALTRLVPPAASPGSLVRIEGEDLFVLGQHPEVRFGRVQAAVFARSDDDLLVVVPEGADGDVRVSLAGRTSNALPFETLRRGTPTIRAVVPATVAPGEVATIRGRDLHDLTGLLREGGLAALPLRLPRVTFGDREAFFVLPTEEGLRALVPFGLAPGPVDVVVEEGEARSDAFPVTIR